MVAVTAGHWPDAEITKPPESKPLRGAARRSAHAKEGSGYALLGFLRLLCSAFARSAIEAVACPRGVADIAAALGLGVRCPICRDEPARFHDEMGMDGMTCGGDLEQSGKDKGKCLACGAFQTACLGCYGSGRKGRKVGERRRVSGTSTVERLLAKIEASWPGALRIWHDLRQGRDGNRRLLREAGLWFERGPGFRAMVEALGIVLPVAKLTPAERSAERFVSSLAIAEVPIAVSAPATPPVLSRHGIHLRTSTGASVLAEAPCTASLLEPKVDPTLPRCSEEESAPRIDSLRARREAPAPAREEPAASLGEGGLWSIADAIERESAVTPPESPAERRAAYWEGVNRGAELPPVVSLPALRSLPYDPRQCSTCGRTFGSCGCGGRPRR